MTSRYVPTIGDVVEYENQRMVIVKINLLSMLSDYDCYLLSESLITDFKDDTETELFLSNCIHTIYNTQYQTFPFTKVGAISLNVQEISFIKITLKE